MSGLISMMLGMAGTAVLAPMTGLDNDLGYMVTATDLTALNLSQQQVEGYL